MYPAFVETKARREIPSSLKTRPGGAVVCWAAPFTVSNKSRMGARCKLENTEFETSFFSFRCVACARARASVRPCVRMCGFIGCVVSVCACVSCVRA